jgi:hypothetical protein
MSEEDAKTPTAEETPKEEEEEDEKPKEEESTAHFEPVVSLWRCVARQIFSRYRLTIDLCIFVTGQTRRSGSRVRRGGRGK